MENKSGKKISYILAVVVLLSLLFIIYYFVVYKSTEEKRLSLDNKILEIEDQISLEKNKYDQIVSMEKEIKSLKIKTSNVPEYDSEGLELEYLNEIMQNAINYDLSFSTPTLFNSNFVRRKVNISFNAMNYKDSVEIIKGIINCPYRTILNGITFSPYGSSNIKDLVDRSLSGNCKVSVSLDMYFIEFVTENTNLRGLEK